MVFGWKVNSPRTSNKRSWGWAEEKQEMNDEQTKPTTTRILSKLFPAQDVLAKKKRTEDTSQEVLQLREQEADDASDGDNDSVTSVSPQEGMDMQDTEEEDASKDKATKVVCPCGCTAYSHSSAHNFRTHEKDTMQLYIFSPAITNYRGKRYSADDIAAIWKKDCRKWLWKSCRNDVLE